MAAGAYLEFAKVAFSREGTYRPQVFTHIGSVVLRVFLLSMLWTALYRNNGPREGISLESMITYATLALPQLIHLAVKNAPAQIQGLLSSLGNVTGWIAASPQALTGAATLALK